MIALRHAFAGSFLPKLYLGGSLIPFQKRPDGCAGWLGRIILHRVCFRCFSFFTDMIDLLDGTG